MIKTEPNDTAFPAETDNSLGRIGLTKREYFANSAPAEVPAWFDHIKKPYPKKPTDYKLLYTDFDHPVRIELQEYYDTDGNSTLNTKQAKEYIEANDRFYEEEIIWQKENKAERFFQWRTFYADTLINELNEPLPVKEEV